MHRHSPDTSEVDLNLPSTESILFILGVARSGTTFLADLLNEHFDYGMGPESSFVPDLARRRLSRRLELNARELRDMAESIAQSEMLSIARDSYPPEQRFDVTSDEILRRTRTRSYAGLVRGAFRAVADFQGKTHLATKLPLYWLHTRLLENLFGNSARYLWIVRDGRDTALSLMQMPWGQKTPYACAKHWAQSMAALDTFQRQVDPRRLLVVRYEDLLCQPKRQLTRINHFVAEPCQEDVIDRLADEISHGAMAGNFGKWRQTMPSNDVRIFEAVAGRWLRQYGYPTSFDSPSISWYERAFGSCTEILHRVRLTLAKSF